jgi:transposase
MAAVASMSIRSFDLLGFEHCRRLQAVIMDRRAFWQLQSQRHCPKAAIVFDLFHFIAR